MFCDVLISFPLYFLLLKNNNNKQFHLLKLSKKFLSFLSSNKNKATAINELSHEIKYIPLIKIIIITMKEEI